MTDTDIQDLGIFFRISLRDAQFRIDDLNIDADEGDRMLADAIATPRWGGETGAAAILAWAYDGSGVPEGANPKAWAAGMLGVWQHWAATCPAYSA